jgi:hypothetical protein
VKAQLIPLQRPAAVETKSIMPISPEEENDEDVVAKPAPKMKGKRKIDMSKVPSKGKAPPAPLPQPEAGPMYFEHQVGVLCGKHALNNLLGAEVFKNSELMALCKRLMKNLKLTVPLCDKNGFYGDEVIETALKEKGYDVQDIYEYEGGQRFVNEETGAVAPATGPANNPKYRGLSLDMVLRQGHTIGNFLGILIVNGGHWIAIKKVEDGYIWLDSLYDAPNEARDKIIDFGSEDEELDTQIEAMIQKAKDFNGGLYIRKEDVAKTKDAKDDALLKKQKKKKWRGSEMAQGHNRILAVYRGEAHDFFPEVRAYQPAEARGMIAIAEPDESAEEVVPAGPKSILKRKNVGTPLEPNAVLSVAVEKPKRRIAPPPPAPSTPPKISAEPKTPDEVLKAKKKIRIQSVPNVRIISPREERKKQNLEEVDENEEDEFEAVPLSDDELDEIEVVPLSDNNKPKKSVVNLLDELENDEEEEEEDEEDEEDEEEDIQAVPLSPNENKPKKSALNLLDELEDDEDEEEEEEEEEIKPKKSALNLLDELENDEDEEDEDEEEEEEEEIKPKKSAVNLLDELEDDE